MKTENQTSGSKIANSATFKAIVIGALILLMMIPVMMVRGIISERQSNSESVAREISSKWGNRQTLAGPVICVPYRYTEIINNRSESQTMEVRSDIAYFLPDELNVETTIKPDVRSYSIYSIVVYQAEIKASGTFKHPEFEKLNRSAVTIEWENAYITIGISDLRGIRNNIIFNWDGVPKETVSGVDDTNIAESGVTVKTPLLANSNSAPYHFDFTLTLNGSYGLFFVPVGKTTHVTAASTWESPSFTGQFLPDERDIDKGFDATWNVFNYNRNFPQMWTGKAHHIHSAEFGVNLVMPVDHYQKAERSVKYAIMFIALTFLVFFLVELISRRRIHPLQYLLVSIGLVLFYSLLLALSEHMHFNLAYLLSSLAIIALITAYSHSIFKSPKQTTLMGIFLVALYLFLYTVLQLQDMSLLIGSIGLFIALAIVMYISRKVDWYHTHNDDPAQTNLADVPRE